METTEEEKCCETKKCACFCHKMPGVFIILVGVAILLRALNVLGHTPFWITVSVIVILAGLQYMLAGMCKCCDRV
jgi:uncharacterized protein YqgC (DUF456 family)